MRLLFSAREFKGIAKQEKLICHLSFRPLPEAPKYRIVPIQILSSVRQPFGAGLPSDF
jgi:hypothetical protein